MQELKKVKRKSETNIKGVKLAKEKDKTFCPNCGKFIKKLAAICPYCGAKPENPPLEIGDEKIEREHLNNVKNIRT
ncbi:MAG: zinc ribbon domain-containing protein, partial [Actinobacteria bacterium]|nr:zinc ribbon domain-containing protein [Actinomycetota bacterium]